MTARGSPEHLSAAALQLVALNFAIEAIAATANEAQRSAYERLFEAIADVHISGADAWQLPLPVPLGCLFDEARKATEAGSRLSQVLGIAEQVPDKWEPLLPTIETLAWIGAMLLGEDLRVIHRAEPSPLNTRRLLDMADIQAALGGLLMLRTPPRNQRLYRSCRRWLDRVFDGRARLALSSDDLDAIRAQAAAIRAAAR